MTDSGCFVSRIGLHSLFFKVFMVRCVEKFWISLFEIWTKLLNAPHDLFVVQDKVAIAV